MKFAYAIVTIAVVGIIALMITGGIMLVQLREMKQHKAEKELAELQFHKMIKETNFFDGNRHRIHDLDIMLEDVVPFEKNGKNGVTFKIAFYNMSKGAVARPLNEITVGDDYGNYLGGLMSFHPKKCLPQQKLVIDLDIMDKVSIHTEYRVFAEIAVPSGDKRLEYEITGKVKRPVQ